MATRLLPAVGSPGVEASVALPADHLVAVVLLGQQTEGGLNHASSQTENLDKKRFMFSHMKMVYSLYNR